MAGPLLRPPGDPSIPVGADRSGAMARFQHWDTKIRRTGTVAQDVKRFQRALICRSVDRTSNFTISRPEVTGGDGRPPYGA